MTVWTEVERGARVRWSDEGFRSLGCRRAYRYGTFKGMTKRGVFAKVLWDGLRPSSVSTLHPDFIELDNDGETKDGK